MVDRSSSAASADRGQVGAFAPAFLAGGENTTALAHEVIRRVAAQAREMKSATTQVTPERVTGLARALLGPDDGAAAELVRDARLQGVKADDLYHGLVAGAVKLIGTAWARDEIVLPEVVRASGRVWRILRDLREVFVRVTDQVPGQRAVFALCPDECHTIGMTMTADDLRRRGWDIELLIGYDHEALVERLESIAPMTVALAATMSDLTLPLARTVVALKAHLPGIWVMVAGGITQKVPDILTATGADAVANTADQAEDLMLAHFAEMAERRTNRA
ncbi:B12-binding domain-containing protein [Rhodobacter sp. Har01]|uniref:cobalamin B12-binding domain-containing protein n=1 Tax=Rhodobacter sp. Har01 TaxID=2883999 RepID=UPI001D07ED73|nr:cobalamin-dependent protein [Rhodobacter sp. Har01]MCB6178807.1 B12-binding domain-containing protein [Rhodobacter sp. Har01]